MNKKDIRELLDICFVAKKITETMKELPKGIKPRHIHVIECIYSLDLIHHHVRISDVSEMLKITMPSVTKLMNELDEKGVLHKYNLDSDKRVILVKLTALGETYYDQYVEKYHSEWANNLSDIRADEVACAIRVIKALQQSMPSGVTHV